MKKYFKGLFISVAALALISTHAVAASAVTARPMTFDVCGTNGASGAYNCMYVNGYGDVAYEVRGWSHATTQGLIGTAVHEEVQGPNGDAICNSATITLTNTSQVVGCQESWSPPVDILAGQYCAILWAWEYGPDPFESVWHWTIAAENCGTVSI